MDADLARLRSVTTAEGFCDVLETILASSLTSDYWRIGLPTDLDSSSARNPELFCYVASQNLLSSRVLFSHKYVKDLLDPALQLKKKALDRHHLFPRAWLERQGVKDLRDINQMANYALLEWPENISISDTAPEIYVPRVQERFSSEEWQSMMRDHALPEGWQALSYSEFLLARRKLMAEVIRRGFESLGTPQGL